MTTDQLKFLHTLISEPDHVEWVGAANLILVANGLNAAIEDDDGASKVIYKLFYDLLEDENYMGAATLQWGETMFDIRPQYVSDVFRCIKENALLLIQGASSTSKTYSAGAWMYLDWRRDPAYTAIKVAAFSEKHLRENIFSHIRTLHRSCAIPYENPGDVKDIDLYFGLKSAGDQFGFSGVAFKQSSEATGHFKGYKPMPYRKAFHPKFGNSTRVRILGDEGQNWPDGPFKDFASPMSCIDGVEHVKIIITYNPESVGQRVVQLAEPEQGWMPEDQETLYEWVSKEGWYVLRLDAKLCENVVQRKVIYPNFQTYEGFLKLLRGEGDVSSRYSTFARGWPPLRTQNWTVIPPAWPSSQRGEAIFDEIICHCASIDCAYQGMDKVLMAVGRFGIASGWTKTNGETITFMDPLNPKHKKSRPVMQFDQLVPLTKSNSPTKLAEEIRGQCTRMQIPANFVVVDGTGQGSGTASFLKEYWGDVLLVDWAKGASTMKILSEDQNTAKERYDGIISEMHFAFQKWLNPEVCAILIHPQISPNPINTQMSTRRWCYVKGGKQKVESKAEFKARNQRSPDEHDAMIMLPFLIRSRANVLPGMATQVDNRTPPDEDSETIKGSDSPREEGLRLGESKDVGRGLEF